MRRWASIWMVALASAAWGGCSSDGDEAASAPPATKRDGVARAEHAAPRAPVDRYEPARSETFPNGKLIAARAVERALTYEPGASPGELAARIAEPSARAGAAAALGPAVEPRSASHTRAVYPQLSGSTDTTLGLMVLVKQVLTREDGERLSLTRIVDVRLRRAADGPWTLERIASVGGREEADMDRRLAREARAVLEHPRIVLSDSARWDIRRGRVDRDLLLALGRAAERHRIQVGAIASGHPENVWATSRPSAHSRGAAADIYAVDGRKVIDQADDRDSPAFALATSLMANGAKELGSPWDLDGSGGRSFSDVVHEDHLHLQQR